MKCFCRVCEVGDVVLQMGGRVGLLTGNVMGIGVEEVVEEVVLFSFNHGYMVIYQREMVGYGDAKNQIVKWMGWWCWLRS